MTISIGQYFCAVRIGVADHYEYLEILPFIRLYYAQGSLSLIRVVNHPAAHVGSTEIVPIDSAFTFQ
jgi:hypothetical protein